MKRTDIDMLNGGIGAKLLMFAIPLALTGMLQQLFNAADVAVVGRFVGEDAMAAVGSNSAIIGLLVNGFIGIALGANVVISNFIGQGDHGSVSKCVHTSILFPLIGGICMTVIGELLAPNVLELMGVPDNVFQMSLDYLQMYLLGMPVIFLYNFEAAIFRSQGDTRTPLFCLIFSGIMNVLLNLLFVCVVGMAADGVALATVLSNAISSALLLMILTRREYPLRVVMHEVRIHGDVLKMIVRIGLPAGLQSMVFSLSNMCIQSAVNSLGSEVMAASSAAFNIEILAYYLVNAFGQGCTTFVGQNYGAGQLERCKRITKISLLMDVGITAAASFIMLMFGTPLLKIFNDNPAIAEIGLVRLRYILAWEALNAVIEIMSGSMRGYGYSLVPAVLTFAGVCGIRIAWVYTVFEKYASFDSLMMVYPVSWIATGSALVIAYLLYVRKIARKAEE